MEKLKVYEQSYHSQEKRLQQSLDKVDSLTHEKNNIEIAHNELIMEFTTLRHEKEKLTMETNA